MVDDKYSRLKRPRNPMPDYVRESLIIRGLMDAYLDRPAYQQNDYIGWINHAVQQKTKEKRLKQMIDELKHGGLYMKMKYKAGKNV